MSEDVVINRLRWKCRRGMKELDAVLTHYLDHHFGQATAPEQRAFETLLDMQDPELYFLVLGKTTSDSPEISNVVSLLQNTPRY